MTTKTTYRYRLTSTGESSSKYGACEICQEKASEVSQQSEEKSFDDNGRQGWTQHECHRFFGHAECLVSKRR